MQWTDIQKLQPLKLNIGGRHQHHPRAKWRGYVSIGLGVSDQSDAWAVLVKLPAKFNLPNQSVDAALSEHFIEHLTTTDAVEDG